MQLFGRVEDTVRTHVVCCESQGGLDCRLAFRKAADHGRTHFSLLFFSPFWLPIFAIDSTLSSELLSTQLPAQLSLTLTG